MNIPAKCAECGNQILKRNLELMDDSLSGTRPISWFCSSDCMNLNFQKQAAAEDEMNEYDNHCARAITKGVADTGISFDEASDGLIMSWIDEYPRK